MGPHLIRSHTQMLERILDGGSVKAQNANGRWYSVSGMEAVRQWADKFSSEERIRLVRIILPELHPNKRGAVMAVLTKEERTRVRAMLSLLGEKP